MAFSDNQEQHRKALRGLQLKMIISSLPAAASHSDCRRRSHPDCRATQYFREGRIQEIADYCETDVINTYRVWLRYELFRGRLTDVEYERSEQNLTEFINARATSRLHLALGMKVEVVGP